MSLPQKVFTGVGANANTAILFARRLTVEEDKAVQEADSGANGCRMPKELGGKKVLFASPGPERLSLEDYLSDLAMKANDAAGNGLWS